MANRAKEDEKNERIIRGLLKLPENRRCINCNSLGPQYVCTNFWTFVCTTCSGIHREFTHRVKSVSMAKFTSQEVSALQGGGNASAKEIYFKEWDTQRNSFPDGSNVERLRDFIKHVYVDRRYTGERSFEKPPRAKMGDAEDSENRRVDTYQGGSRSPPYEDTYERRLSDRPSPGGRSDDRNYRNTYDERRSPGYDTENKHYGDYRKSPARTEIVNDWRREDRFGNGRKTDDSSSDGLSRPVGRSPDHQRDLDASSPPVVRPVRDILGENVSPLRIIEPPKNDGRSTDVSTRTQRTASSSSLASSNGNPVEVRVESSLIDFDTVSEPPVKEAVSQTQDITANVSDAQPTSSISDNWANFDAAPEVKVSQIPSNANSLESVLSELSVPTAVSGSSNASVTGALRDMSLVSSTNLLAAPVGNAVVQPFGTVAPGVSSASNSTQFPPTVTPAAAARPVSILPVIGGQWPNLHPQQSLLYPASVSQPTAQPFSPVFRGASANQPWNSLVAPNARGPPAASAAQAPQARSAVEATTAGIATQPSVEVKPSGRKELPEDLFSMNHAAFPVPVPGWHTGPLNGMGLTTYYHIPTPLQAFPQSSKSTNPFDLGNDPPLVQATMFPSMVSLQSALPNMAPSTGLLGTSSLGTPTPAWGPPQSSHPLAMSLQPPSFSSPIPPVSYMGQQVLNSMPPRPQGMGFGPEVASFGTTNPNPQLAGLHSAALSPNTYSSVGGNPFG